MAYKMSAEEIQEFAGKLTKWSESLTNNERTLLTQILEDHGQKKRAELSNTNLKALLANKLQIAPFHFAEFSPKLNAKVVGQMCW